MSTTVTVTCRASVACFDCYGDGRSNSGLAFCRTCDGNGHVPCEADLTVEVDGDREGWCIESVAGCPHAEKMEQDDKFADDVLAALADQDQDACERAHAIEYDRRESEAMESYRPRRGDDA